jgi:hypothetical protein
MTCCSKKSNVVGEIRTDGLYTLAEIKARLGLGYYSLKEARKKGLITRKIGRRSYVLGKDLLDFVSGKGVEHDE